MPSPNIRLQAGEQVLLATIPSALWTWSAYGCTLGLYHFWRIRHHWIVTNQRFISQRGLIARHERALPLERIQDVSTKASPLTGGSVAVSTAGGVLGVGAVGPLTRQGAYDFADALMAAQANLPRTLLSESGV
jgi:membrane protein YdbS with pleckstrin-like domain